MASNIKQKDLIPLYLLLLGFVSYGKILFVKDVFWDDNCWLEAIYASSNLREFLNAGFVEMRRIPLGAFFYYFFGLHDLTNHAVFLWQAFNIGIQVVTPLLIYRLATNLSSKNRALGTAVAVFFIVAPLDHTLPYLSAINYRLGLLLSLISLLFSERAVAGMKTRWGLMITSLAFALFTQYVLTESAVALEPARALIFWHFFRKRGASSREGILKATSHSSLFFAGMVPLIIYKMLNHPFGMYEGIYKTDVTGLLNWKMHAWLTLISLRGLWASLLKSGGLSSPSSMLLGAAAAVFAFRLLRRVDIPLKINNVTMETSRHNSKPLLFVFSFAFTVLLSQHVMFAIAGRPLALGADSSHAALLQIGYAMIGGALIAWLLSRINADKKQITAAALAMLIGIGVYFNNLNLSLYNQGSARQVLFWKNFIARFPALPPSATLFIDATDPFFFYTSDTDNTYDLELYINMLYAPSIDSKSFRRYRVLSVEDEFRDIYRQNPSDIAKLKPISRVTHFGKEILDPRTFIVVHYRNGELLVNEEILTKHPNVSYAAWAKKPFPALPRPLAQYPLRSKVPGFQ